MSRQSIAEYAGKTNEEVYAGYTWRENYNNLRCIINRWLVMNVAWISGEGYKVSVAGVAFKACFTDREKACQFAVERAKGLLSEALGVMSK